MLEDNERFLIALNTAVRDLGKIKGKINTCLTRVRKADFTIEQRHNFYLRALGIVENFLTDVCEYIATTNDKREVK